MYKQKTAFFLAIIVLIVDILTKFLTVYHIPLSNFSGIPVFKDLFGISFSLVHATNKGAAWGIFSEWQQELLYFRIFLIICLLIYLLFFNKKKAYGLPLALIAAGALGNVLDYFLYGHVIDMFYFNFWGYEYPVFNVADSAIFIGIIWITILSFRI